MSSLIGSVVALARAESRAAAATELGRALGGDTVLVFLRDREVDALLPAPGFPQTLRSAREWRRFLDACVAEGSAAGALTPPAGGAAVPAFAVAHGRDCVMVVLGAAGPNGHATSLRELLPLLAEVFDREQAEARAEARSRMARSAAAHAEELAHALDAVRRQLQQALTEAEGVHAELQRANERLSEQAVQLEAQAVELQRTNAELEAALDAAQAGSRAKSEFLATMSHELRTPLNAIAGHVQLIELGIYGPVTEVQREALVRIDRSQRHLLRLINDILNHARIEAGRIDYRLEEVRLSAVLDDLAPMIGPQVASKGLRCRLGPCDARLVAWADREKLEQILLNLISNAVKFTHAGGEIAVTADEHPERAGLLVIQVRDTGVGIPPDKLEAIFEPFMQVDASHSRVGQGVGLGLSISRDLARGMGGDLTAASRIGHGSLFTLALPAV